MPSSASLKLTCTLAKASAVLPPSAGSRVTAVTCGGVTSPESPWNSYAPLS